MKARIAMLICLLALASRAQDAGQGTPVKTAPVVRRSLAVVVEGNGRTDALEQQKVRAPFKGLLVTLTVADGDRVRDRQVIGELVAQESASAIEGARAMVQSARTAQEKADARRALQLATRGLVRTRLRAPEAGVVVGHGADEGALVAEGQDIVSLAASDSFVFIARVVQSDLARIRPGQRCVVQLTSRPAPFRGLVHGVLPSAEATDLTAPVRIDLQTLLPDSLGLFGTASITVDEKRDATAVPQAAVLRDDVYGTQRMALVQAGHAHWADVKTGISQGGFVEITSPSLAPGTTVITDGQVGLPEGAPVQVSP